MNKSKLKKFSVDRPIVLIGMMGAGKTSVGRALAELLALPFFDSDAEIEAAAGKSIPQIFADSGEAEFRRMEREAVLRLLGCGACVLSIGGGAFMDDLTRGKIGKKAFSVWIKVDEKILLSRIRHDDKRPLLKGGDGVKKFKRIFSARLPVYAEADLAVACNDDSVEDNAKKIIAALQAAPAFQIARA